MDFFADNSENVHNKEVIRCISDKIRRLTELYGKELSSYSLFQIKKYVYQHLVVLLSYQDKGIYYKYFMFIQLVFKSKSSSYTYGPDIMEIVLLYYIIRHLNYLRNTQDPDIFIYAARKFYNNVGECIEYRPDDEEHNYKLICVNGRISRYLESFVGLDPDIVLRSPINDPKEVRCYILQKIRHLFLSRLKEYPSYYDAYVGPVANQEDIPCDAEAIWKKILREALESIKDELPDDIDPDIFADSFI